MVARLSADGLATVGAITIGFGIAVLTLRIQREVSMDQQGEITWIPVADRLVLAATSLSSVAMVALISVPPSGMSHALVAGLLAGSLMLLLGYPWAVLAHYRLLGSKRTGSRTNPEPPEGAIFWVTVALAAMVGLATLVTSHNC